MKSACALLYVTKIHPVVTELLRADGGTHGRTHRQTHGPTHGPTHGSTHVPTDRQTK